MGKLSNLFLWIRSADVFRKYTAVKCGHETKRCGTANVLGRTMLVEVPLNGFGGVDYCVDCTAKQAVPCAWCGEPIISGDRIALFKERHREKDSIVCTRFGCADTDAERPALWGMNEEGGFVKDLR